MSAVKMTVTNCVVKQSADTSAEMLHAQVSYKCEF